MATNVSGVTKHWITAQAGFTTTLSSTISSGATTVPLNSVAGYTNGDQVALVIDPSDITKKQVCTGTVDTSGNQLTGVVWTEGTNQTHTAGATVVDYTTATHQAATAKGAKVSHNDDGTLKTAAVQSALGLTSLNGYLPLGYTPNTVTYNGNRSYDMVFNGVDLTGTVSNGMRLRTTRTVAAPTQCTSLNGTTQYYSKTSPAGMTFTDNFTAMGWVKLSAYSTSVATIIGRRDGSGNGWGLSITPAGQVNIYGASGGNFDTCNSYQSIPLNKWVHVVATLSMATTTSTIYIDGVLVPSTYTNGSSSSLVQAGNLQVGAYNGATEPLAGKVAQAAVFSTVLSATTIRSYTSQTLTGTETGLISAYSFNNSINDLNTTNANNLTANGSAVATNADSPFTQDDTGTPSGTNDFAIVTKKLFSTNTTITVQVPEGCTIPTSGGISSVVYSSNDVPFGFPLQREKWRIASLICANTATTANATYGSFSSGGWVLLAPVGNWNIGWMANTYNSTTTAVTWNLSSTVLTGLSANAGAAVSRFGTTTVSPSASTYEDFIYITQPQSLTTTTNYIMYTVGNTTGAGLSAVDSVCESFAEFGYL